MQNRPLLSLYMLNQRIHHMDFRRRSSRGLRHSSEISPRLLSGCLPCSKHLLWMCAAMHMHTRCNFTCGDPCTLSDVNCEEPHCCGSLDLCLHFPMLADDWNCKHSLPHTSKRRCRLLDIHGPIGAQIAVGPTGVGNGKEDHGLLQSYVLVTRSYGR